MERLACTMRSLDLVHLYELARAHGRACGKLQRGLDGEVRGLREVELGNTFTLD